VDTITMENLEALLDRGPGWHVSLYMPAHRAGRETEQDPIRLKNLLSEAERRLLDKQMRRPDVLSLLRPVQELLDDPSFWRRQSDGLALFVSPELAFSYRLPLRFEELVVISNRFHLKPMLRYFANDGHFYVLALSQSEVRLLEGTRHSVDEIDLEGMPPSLAETISFEKHLQYHSSTGAGAPGQGRAGAFFGHDMSDEAKGQILRWFRRVTEALPAVFRDVRAPIVLAGVDYLLPLFREASALPQIVEKGVAGNPEELKAETLHAKAWPVVQPLFATAQQEAAAQVGELSAVGRATSDVAEAVIAAHHGRVEALFVAVDVQAWGTFDPAVLGVSEHTEPEPGDEDLLDLAAVRTLLTRGAVFAVAPDEVPGGGALAAVLRW
jgi:hypothetical protein